MVKQIFGIMAQKGNPMKKFGVLLSGLFCNGLFVCTVWATSPSDVVQANLDDSHAQLQRAEQYYFAEGLPDYQQALPWFEKSAKQGNATAQYYLGVMYHEAQGVERDDTQAAYWFTQAAKQGDSDAQFMLGNLYLFGNGVELDNQQAFYWLEKASEQGHNDAQGQLGLNYYFLAATNYNSEPYLQLALKWLGKACQSGAVHSCEYYYDLKQLLEK